MPKKKKGGGAPKAGKPGSAAAQAAASAPAAAGTGPPGRKPRGHRQKGAGTTVASRGDVKVGSMTMKEWQRTPVQLLHELSQQQKRPRPKYGRLRAAPGDAPGHVRCRVILQDQKKPGTDKDLLFLPKGSFKNEEEARHGIALLALKALTPLQPLERKLPEPYAAMWRAMDGASSKGSAQPAKPRAAPAPRPPPAAATAAASSSSAAAASVPAPASFASSWDDDGAASTASSRRSAGSVRVLELANKHLSARDRTAARKKKDDERRGRQNAREARIALDPNKPHQVLMAEAVRRRVEAVLRAVEEAAGPGGGGGGIDPETAEEAVEGTVALGFSEERAAEALQAVRDAPPASAELGTADGVASAMVDWLCLRLPEAELPKAFDPRGRNLGVIAPVGSEKVAEAARAPQGRLAAAGFHAADAMAALHRSGGALWGAADVLLREAMAAVGDAAPAEWPAAVPEGEADADAADALGEELELLSAVFGDDVTHAEAGPAEHTAEGCAVRVVVLPLPGKCSLHAAVRVPMTSGAAAEPWRLYPNTAPSFLVLPCSGELATGVAEGPHRVAAAVAAAEAAVSVLGLQSLSSAHQAAMEAMETLAAASDDGPAAGRGKGKGKPRGKPRPVPRSVLANQEAAAAKAGRLARPLLPLLPPRADEAAVRAAKRAMAAPAGGAAASGRGRRGGGSRQGGGGVTGTRSVSSALRSEFRRLDDELRAGASAAPSGQLRRMNKVRAALPIASYRDEVVRTVRENRVVVLRGETGCGKSTQLPQFLLEDAIARGEGGRTHIVVTQPRRLAALGLARRVAAERCEQVASGSRGGPHRCVGYHIRGERKASATTSLVFCTTGILLRQLQGGLDGAVTHIVVDEVHERSVDADFLLAVLREVLPHRPDLRVVLMSATVDAGKFQDYFAPRRGAPCPVIEVPGFVHPVRQAYMEEVLAITDAGGLADPPDAEACFRDGPDMGVAADLIAAVAAGRGLPSPAPDRRRVPGPLPPGGGATLVFLPGVPEIRRLARLLQGEHSVHVVELHGGLTGEAQTRVFDPPPEGKVKVVLATNVAETSVTIDGVTTVIDLGRVKQTQYDAMNRMSRLVEGWTARDSATQRLGRAGRTRPGVCYRLYPRPMWDRLPPHSVPEIRRVALESLCLQIRVLGLGGVRAFLARCMDPPSASHVDSALRQLEGMGAVTPKAPGAAPGAAASSSKASASEEFDLTPLGRHMSRLPLDVRLAKCLIFGAVLRCIDPVLTIAASLSNRSPLLSPRDAREAADAAHRRFVDGHSDHLLLARAFEAYRAVPGGYRAKREFCERSFLSFDGMRTIGDLRRDYAATLHDIGFLPGGGRSGGGGDGGRYGEESAAANAHAGDNAVVRSALVAGLFPNVVKVVYPPPRFVDTAGGSTRVDPSSRELRLYTRADDADPEVAAALRADTGPRPWTADRPPAASTERPKFTIRRGVAQQRVFLHPQSACFHVGRYVSPWVVFNEKSETHKVFVRDATAAPPYAMLLFGGSLTVKPEQGLIHVGAGEWTSFSAAGRIGALVSGLRTALDGLLEAKVADPGVPVHTSPVVEVMVELLRGGGM